MRENKLRCVGWIAVSSKAQADDDKFSLEKQEADIRALCDQRGWQLIDILRVPGFSRNFYTIDEAAKAMRKEGISAFDDLKRHIDQRDFDVFCVRDADRFGRSLPLVTEVTARLRDAGIQIHTIAKGEVSPETATFWSAMAGISAQSDIERLNAYRAAGMKKRALRGLTGARIVFSHQAIRDTKGKMIGIEPNPDMRLFIDDAVRIFLRGVNYAAIEAHMTELGHTNLSGNPLKSMIVHKLLYHPTFWGNSAYGFRRRPSSEYGLWCFDPDVPLPSGVEMTYNTHEPSLKGELAERVKAEMRRRAELVKGGALSAKTHIFTGLLICGECGFTMFYHTNRRKDGTIRASYSCNTPSSPFRQKQPCSNRTSLTIASGKEQITKMLLKPIFDGLDIGDLVKRDESAAMMKAQHHQLSQQVNSLNDEIRNLIRLQVRNPKLEVMYQDEIDKSLSQLDVAKARLRELEVFLNQGLTSVSQQYGIEELRRIGISAFWQFEEHEIHQQLHRLLGKYRFIVQGGLIVGIV